MGAREGGRKGRRGKRSRAKQDTGLAAICAFLLNCSTHPSFLFVS